jgi:hypothetical protein
VFYISDSLNNADDIPQIIALTVAVINEPITPGPLPFIKKPELFTMPDSNGMMVSCFNRGEATL